MPKQKLSKISKIGGVFVLKCIFPETKYVCVPTKFHVSSMIQTSFRHGVLLPSPYRKMNPLKGLPRLGLNIANFWPNLEFSI